MHSKIITAAAIALAGTIASANAEQINVYVHANYGGSDRVITESVANMADIGFNDHVSSYIVKSGTWELCEHANFRGRCVTVTSRDPDLTTSGFNDTISSIRLVGERRGDRGGNGGWGDRGGNGDWGDRGRDRNRDDRGWDNDSRGGIEIYVDANYSGARTGVNGNVRNLQDIGFNDTISSIRINSGTWEFCEHANFEGRCVTYDRDVNWVGNEVNDRISSIRRVR